MTQRKDSEKPDWDDLLVRARALDTPLTDDELKLWEGSKLDGNARMWNEDYVHALQKAVEGQQLAQLEAMLAAEIPPPAFLLPVIAQLWKSKSGRPAALTASEDMRIRWFFSLMTRHWGMEAAAARKELSRMLELHAKTINRSLARTAPQD